MDHLLVIDMQEDYVGENRNRKRYGYDAKTLVSNVNDRILTYPADAVIYITNRFFWESAKRPKSLVTGLSVVSGRRYEKRKADAFSNQSLLAYLRENNADRLELVGVDGNFCIAASALGARENGFDAVVEKSCIGIGNQTKFIKVKARLEQSGVVVRV